jgi:hypothetical protein
MAAPARLGAAVALQRYPRWSADAQELDNKRRATVDIRSFQKRSLASWIGGVLAALAAFALVVTLVERVRSGHGADSYTSLRGIQTRPIAALLTLGAIFLMLVIEDALRSRGDTHQKRRRAGVARCREGWRCVPKAAQRAPAADGRRSGNGRRVVALIDRGLRGEGQTW